MNYEEKYKSALKWMQSLYGGLHGATKEEAEKYFPELKESEDEQSRKWILEYLYDGLRKSDEQFKGQFKTAIAWLERQGKQHPHVDVNKMVDKFAHTEVKGYGVPSMIEVDAYRRGIEDALEKQCERNFDYEHADIPQKDFAPIEPKFKVGDWIVLPLGIIAHIESLNSTDYQVTTTDGKICDFKISKQDNYRLWTINDAKDGDLIYVSTEKKGIQAIFHEYKNDTIFFHCYLCTDFVQGGCMPIGSVELTYPLQKTHYNRFFEKMHEAGYEWIQKEKKLIKIKETKFKVRDWLQYRDAKPFLVEEITKQGYCNGNSCLPFEWEDEIHLWTIEDAKRGDVLVDVYGNIGIFDKCYDFDWMSCCSLGNNGGFQHFKVEHENEKTYPASKEQRDLFFSKMKEEGWEWDSENKELKKNL